MKHKTIRTVRIAFAAVIGLLLLTVLAALLLLHLRSSKLRVDVSSVLRSEKYGTPVSVEGVEVITQDVSCGYAVLEMFGAWSGRDVTEESLYAAYGKVVTSTGRAFCREMNKQFPEYTTVMHKYLTDAELLEAVYDTLSAGIPVPIEWAALYGDEWTLHYSLVTGMDLPNDRITVANPYGYWEELTVGAFLERTSFAAFRRMPVFLKLGFAFGIFEKNTVFSVRSNHPTGVQSDMEKETVTFTNGLRDADVWILPRTEKNLKTTVWGTATVPSVQAGESRRAPLCAPGDDGLYIFRMIDTGGYYYSADGIVLEAGWTLRIEGKDLHSVKIEVLDDHGESNAVYDVFAARL